MASSALLAQMEPDHHTAFTDRAPLKTTEGADLRRATQEQILSDSRTQSTTEDGGEYGPKESDARAILSVSRTQSSTADDGVGRTARGQHAGGRLAV